MVSERGVMACFSADAARRATRFPSFDIPNRLSV